MLLIVSSGSFNKDLHPPPTLFKVIFWLGYFNSCLNPIIYPCYSREFKQAFIRILRCRWKRKRQGWQAYYNYRRHEGSHATSFLNGSQQTLASVSPSPPPSRLRPPSSRLRPQGLAEGPGTTGLGTGADSSAN
ncbi:hypothetical protein EPR50_G00142470 [Perca flavescens]|uniref:G-protein coupled receptors family 1 profile domain-containing protein n=1 Tax=Perca flavescens TaxID=8167 RepID=A0A484CNA5_PERFV|nr:hypothetical protein EPR50_G00142470 [Perca flavescens]